MMSILDALGIDRAEEIGVEDGISPFPFEFQTTHEIYHKMEKKMAEAKRPIRLPHCHLTPKHFIKDFQGKIVYIYRDVRAVAASAYPFLQKLPMMSPVMEPYNFLNIDEFAQTIVKDQFWWPDSGVDDAKWQRAAEAGEYKNLLLCKFEDVIADKRTWIKKIADFVGLTDYNIDQVIEQISVANTAERRRRLYEAAGTPFFEEICYRKGESKSWRQELSPETLALFKKKYPHLQD